MQLTVEELIGYTDEERAKWERWFAAHGDGALALALPGEAHASAGALLLHIFGPESQYLQFLRGDELTDYTTRATDRAEPLFEFGREARARTRAFVASAGPEAWSRVVEPREDFPVSARKIVAHVLLHEIRHWAQLAAAVRAHGLAPPGDHDLLFSKALR